MHTRTLLDLPHPSQKQKVFIVLEEFLYNLQAIKRKAAFQYTGRDTVT